MLIGQVIETELGYKLTQDDDGNDLPQGTIKVRVSARGNSDSTTEHYAYPIDVNRIHMPLVGEKVLLIKTPTDQQTAFHKNARYSYVKICNIHNNVNTNVLPFEHVGKADLGGGADPAGGMTGEPLVDDTIAQITHEEKEVPPLQPYDGDILTQDRYGNAFRMSSNASGGPYDQPTQPWSGAPGEPIMVLTAGLNTAVGGLYVIEDLEQDKSSILIGSGQKINLNSSQPMFGPPASAIEASNIFEGAQVMVSSDRILFNSRTDSILLSGGKTVAISTPKWAVDMDEFFTLFDDLLKMLQMVLAGAKPFPTPMGGPTLPNPAVADIIQIITKYKQMMQGG
tara:strand:+ start:518 stop:1534 length:1017 start_codon:yes stop_codon:yes gene_type:complete